MFKTVGIALLVFAGLSYVFDWGYGSQGLIFGLGMLAIGVVVNQRAS